MGKDGSDGQQFMALTSFRTAKPMKILVADDDDIGRSLVEHMLEQAGFEVFAAADGREALEIQAREGIRLVISDWEMPELTGIELCSKIREDECEGYTYVILLTSHAKPAEIVAGMTAGADDFIAKPFNAAELLVRVRAGQRILSMETREMTIFALAKLAESRDNETGQHLERVQRYSLILTQELAKNSSYAGQIDPEFVRLVYQTSPLHDIGKVGIPDSVLQKPGKLTPEEFEIMKRHPVLGAETLDAALEKYPEARFLRVAREIAATHHERWNGAGYPLGLMGLDIPLSGRIVAVADVYDALTSKRCYKAAFSHEKAREILVEDSGKHFDPEIIKAFLAVEAEFVRIRQKFAEKEDRSDVEVLWEAAKAAADLPAVPTPPTTAV